MVHDKRSVVADDTLYIGDNGQVYCGAHLGASARYTGRDLSGQAILAVTPDVLAQCDGFIPCCESCGQ